MQKKAIDRQQKKFFFLHQTEREKEQLLRSKMTKVRTRNQPITGLNSNNSLENVVAMESLWEIPSWKTIPKI